MKISTTSAGRFLLILVVALGLNHVIARPFLPYDDKALEGRWDLTMSINGKSVPSWLEVRHSGLHTLVGDFVGVSGSARPIAKIKSENGWYSFTIPPQWDNGPQDFVFDFTLQGSALSGTMSDADGKKHAFTGVRAPSLRRATAPVWGQPIRIFNGKDLSGWHTEGENQWKVANGLLINPKSGSNLITDRKFEDFKLHIEFRLPAGSNSGVYLRSRYELQIADSKGMEPLKDQLGAIYGFVSPSEMVAKAPGEWQTYDVTLIGRMVTVVANGKMVICNQEIPGITGGAMDSNEGEPGPLFIQGDHGSVEFRNIVLTPGR